MTVAVFVNYHYHLPLVAFLSAEVRSIYVLESARHIFNSGRPKVVSTFNLQVYEVEGFINQQQSTISLTAVVAVNRILNVSVPDPFFPDPKQKKKSGLATRD